MKRNTMAKLASVLALACMWCAASSVANAWDSDPKAGTRKVLRINGVEYAFRYCPPGTFMMGSPESDAASFFPSFTAALILAGSPESEAGRDPDEAQRKVTLDGFWILETEVTQKMWKSVMGTNPSKFSSSGDGSDKVGGWDTSRFPAECVSWYDCVDFAMKLNGAEVAPEGFLFRLPTEAEWEYACRAGTTGPYNVADSSLGALGWYNDNSDERTHAVGGKLANAWGLYDMHGNVLEWCADWYGAYDTASQTNPTGPESGNKRVLRGGSWACRAACCRSAYRWSDNPENGFNNVGVRLVLVRVDSQCVEQMRAMRRFRRIRRITARSNEWAQIQQQTQNTANVDGNSGGYTQEQSQIMQQEDERARMQLMIQENNRMMSDIMRDMRMDRLRSKQYELEAKRREDAIRREQHRIDMDKARRTAESFRGMFGD